MKSPSSTASTTPSYTDGGPIDSVDKAVTIASKFKTPRFGFLVSRGQKDYIWDLQPAVFRRPRWYKLERHMIRELVSTHPQEFADDRSMLDRLVRMQHYGLPTRLLDVSTNFLVSLYFASETTEDNADGSLYMIRGLNGRRKYYDSDTVSVISNLSNLSTLEKRRIYLKSPPSGPKTLEKFNSFPPVDRLLHFIRDEKPYFRPIIDKDHLFRTYMVIPKKSNRRIVAQSGAFLVFGLVDEATRLPPLAGFQLTKYRIPAKSKARIRRSLLRLGITESSLYPEIDKAAAQIAERYKE